MTNHAVDRAAMRQVIRHWDPSIHDDNLEWLLDALLDVGKLQDAAKVREEGRAEVREQLDTLRTAAAAVCEAYGVAPYRNPAAEHVVELDHRHHPDDYTDERCTALNHLAPHNPPCVLYVDDTGRHTGNHMGADGRTWSWPGPTVVTKADLDRIDVSDPARIIAADVGEG